MFAKKSGPHIKKIVHKYLNVKALELKVKVGFFYSSHV